MLSVSFFNKSQNSDAVEPDRIGNTDHSKQRFGNNSGVGQIVKGYTFSVIEVLSNLEQRIVTFGAIRKTDSVKIYTASV